MRRPLPALALMQYMVTRPMTHLRVITNVSKQSRHMDALAAACIWIDVGPMLDHI
jgi:hypothetical protein